MRDSQVPISLNDAGAFPLTVAAWKTKPTWYQTADADHVIPPELQKFMYERVGSTVETVSGGHLAFIAHAEETAKLIKTAATAATASSSRAVAKSARRQDGRPYDRLHAKSSEPPLHSTLVPIDTERNGTIARGAIGQNCFFGCGRGYHPTHLGR